MTEYDPAKPIPIASRRIPLETGVSLAFEHFTGFITEYSANISMGGMFIRSEDPQPPGTMLHFEFKLNDDFKLIHGLGEVVWVRREDEGPRRPPGMGIRFLEIDEPTRELIRRIVESRIQEGEDTFQLDEVSAPPPFRQLADIEDLLGEDPEGELSFGPLTGGKDRRPAASGAAATAVPSNGGEGAPRVAGAPSEAVEAVETVAEAPAAAVAEPRPSPRDTAPLEGGAAAGNGSRAEVARRPRDGDSIDVERLFTERPQVARPIPQRRPNLPARRGRGWGGLAVVLVVTVAMAITAAWYLGGPLTAWLGSAAEGPAAPEPADPPPPPMVAQAPPPAPLPAPPAAAPARGVEDITWQRVEGGTRITVRVDGALGEDSYSHFRIDGPQPREVVRIRGLERPFDRPQLAVNSAELERIRVGFHPKPEGNELHVVLDLAAPGARLSRLTLDGDALELFLERN